MGVKKKMDDWRRRELKETRARDECESRMNAGEGEDG